jgi:hypothetical protein
MLFRLKLAHEALLDFEMAGPTARSSAWVHLRYRLEDLVSFAVMTQIELSLISGEA